VPAIAAHPREVWRPLAIAASLLACLFAGLWLLQFGRSAPPRPTGNTANPAGRFSVAQIGGVGDPHLATVLYDRDAGTLTIRIAAIAAGPTKVPEVWLINGSNPPHSLGFGQVGGAIRMQASARLQPSLVGGATLAITLEPVATHPHAAPSSKILGTGTISTL
jgi:anti-sigma-K factor RskA